MSKVHLIQRSDGALVEAELVVVEPPDLGVIEGSWGPERARLLARLRATNVDRAEWPESLHWNWDRKAPELALLASQGAGIVCRDEWQGAMLVKTTPHVARLGSEQGKPIVYIDYLEAAPWNWRVRALGEEGRYKGVGSVLFREAVETSVREEFHGRVGLHALPQAEPFYEKVCGMTPLGRDPQKQNLLYFEFSREQARTFLDGGE